MNGQNKGVSLHYWLLHRRQCRSCLFSSLRHPRSNEYILLGRFPSSLFNLSPFRNLPLQSRSPILVQFKVTLTASTSLQLFLPSLTALQAHSSSETLQSSSPLPTLIIPNQFLQSTFTLILPFLLETHLIISFPFYWLSLTSTPLQSSSPLPTLITPVLFLQSTFTFIIPLPSRS